MRDLTLEDVGPIKRFRIPLPEQGGVVVLTGEQGAGKSHALRGVQSVLDGKTGDKLPIRDGERKARVEGFGVNVEFGNRRSATGDLEVRSLHGFPVSDFVDPGLVDPVAADSRRIKSLLGLCGTPADLKLFEPLTEKITPLSQLISPETVAKSDIVAMADSIRRDLHSKARGIETQVDELNKIVDNRRSGMADVQNPGVSSAAAEAAQLATTEDVGRLTQVMAETERLASAWDAANAVVQASADPDVAAKMEAAESAVVSAKLVRDQQQAVVSDLEQRLATARIELAARERQLNDAQHSLNSLLESTRSLSAAMNIVKNPRPDTETAQREKNAAFARLAAANDLVNIAKQWEVRDRLQKEVDGLLEERNKKERLVNALREAARGTDQVLSDVICNLIPNMRVEEGRLLYNYPKREKYIPFAELSQGEAYTVAIDIAASVLGHGGVFVLDQAAWGELNLRTRDLVASRCREKGCIMLTAQATEDPVLTSTIYEPRQKEPADAAEVAGGDAVDAGAAGGVPVSGVPEAHVPGPGEEGDHQGPPVDAV